MRRPSRIRSSSTITSRVVACAINFPRPPVTITVNFSPISFSKRETNPSIIAAAPTILPLRRASTVPFAMILRGGVGSTSGSSEAFPARAVIPVFTPQAIMPPMCVLFRSITDAVVAVPKQKTTAGSGYLLTAATSLVMRSAPIISGVSKSIFIPVSIVDFTTRGSMLQSILMHSVNTPVIAGTTQEIIAPSMPVTLLISRKSRSLMR